MSIELAGASFADASSADGPLADGRGRAHVHPIDEGGAGRPRAGADRSVRLAVPADAVAISRIQARALRELVGGATVAGVPDASAGSGAGVDAGSAADLGVVDGAALADRWEATLSSPAPAGCATLVALHASAVAGFAVVVPAPALEAPGGLLAAGAEIAELLIDPDFQRSGHASRLLQAIADTSGAATLRIWVRASDEPRIRLLESAGFGPAGLRRSLAVESGDPIVEHLWWAAIA